MPNWCMNQVSIHADKETLEKIESIVAEDGGDLLAWMVPEPAYSDDQAWYSWRIENWGTKWPFTGPLDISELSDDYISFSFDTAWAPPLQAFETWAQDHPEAEIRLSYYEPGCAFAGVANISNGEVEDNCTSYNDDREEYRAMVMDEWGDDVAEYWDDWTDPEAEETEDE